MRGLTRRLRRGSERKAPSAPQAQLPFPDEGLTRRLRRGRWGCHPEGGSTFFRSERKYQRKHAARRLREKALYCPFWRRGSQCRAQWSWIVFTSSWSALVLAFFRRQNGRAFFPPLPIAALLRRRMGGGEGQIARVGIFPRGVAAFARQKAKRVSKSCWPVARAGGPVARRWSAYANKQETASDRRAARPVAERRPWGRKRRKREALCRVFPKRHTYLYSPRAKGAEWGAGALPLPARRFFLWMGI